MTRSSSVFWIRFDPDWEWQVEGGLKAFKFMRVGHFDGPLGVGRPFQMGGSGETSPMYLLNIKHTHKYNMFQHGHAPRCAPHNNGKYYCPDGGHNKIYNHEDEYVGEPGFKESMGDGNWHQIEIRVKMNSAPGAEDGEYQLWYDGVGQYSRNDVRWRYSDADADWKWNFVSIGGNWDNWFSDMAKQR